MLTDEEKALMLGDALIRGWFDISYNKPATLMSVAVYMIHTWRGITSPLGKILKSVKDEYPKEKK